MTEVIQNTDVSSQPSTSAADTFSTAPASSAPEKMLPQSEVNHLVARYKNEGYEKGRQEALAAQKQNESPAQQTTINPNSAQSSMGGMNQMSHQDIEKLITDRVSQLSNQQQQEAQTRYYQEQGNRIASEIDSKLNDAKTRYEDFDGVVKRDILAQMPDVALMANQFDNAGDVIYDLLKNS